MTSIDGTRLGRAFVYDASDERVGIIDYKAEGGRRETWSIRSQSNQVIRDFERTFESMGGQWRWTKDYVHRGSVLTNTISPGPAGVRDIHTDHLGSVRFMTDSQGHLVLGEGQTTSGNKFWPFGGLVFKRVLSERIAFTGHERDDDGRSGDEADFDYMHARYYAPALGRFLSVDPKTRVDALPQRWNRYSYARNNPVSRFDPDGRDDLPAGYFKAFSQMQSTKFGRDLLAAIPADFKITLADRHTATGLGHRMSSMAAAQVFATPDGAVLALDSRSWKADATSTYFDVRSKYRDLHRVAHEYGHILRAIEFPGLVAAQNRLNEFTASDEWRALTDPRNGVRASAGVPGIVGIMNQALLTMIRMVSDEARAMKEESEAYAEEVAGRILTEHAGSERQWRGRE
jgi:RHS repeat-associated protein